MLLKCRQVHPPIHHSFYFLCAQVDLLFFHTDKAKTYHNVNKPVLWDSQSLSLHSHCCNIKIMLNIWLHIHFSCTSREHILIKMCDLVFSLNWGISPNTMQSSHIFGCRSHVVPHFSCTCKRFECAKTVWCQTHYLLSMHWLHLNKKCTGFPDNLQIWVLS